MKLTYPGWSVIASVALWAVCIFALTGCQYGSTILFSQGEAGGVVEMWGGQAEYCKLSATPDIELTEAAIIEFAKKCQADE
jgi:hypothetical protein